MNLCSRCDIGYFSSGGALSGNVQQVRTYVLNQVEFKFGFGLGCCTHEIDIRRSSPAQGEDMRWRCSLEI